MTTAIDPDAAPEHDGGHHDDDQALIEQLQQQLGDMPDADGNPQVRLVRGRLLGPFAAFSAVCTSEDRNPNGMERWDYRRHRKSMSNPAPAARNLRNPRTGFLEWDLVAVHRWYRSRTFTSGGYNMGNHTELRQEMLELITVGRVTARLTRNGRIKGYELDGEPFLGRGANRAITEFESAGMISFPANDREKITVTAKGQELLERWQAEHPRTD